MTRTAHADRTLRFITLIHLLELLHGQIADMDGGNLAVIGVEQLLLNAVHGGIQLGVAIFFMSTLQSQKWIRILVK